MLVNWLAGRPSNKFYALQKAIDELNKSLESMEQREKVCLGKAAVLYEKAKTYYREDYKTTAKLCLIVKRYHEQTAQNNRNYQLLLHEHLLLCESSKKQMIEAMRNEDFTTKKTKQAMGWFKSKAKMVKNFSTKDRKTGLEKAIKKLDRTNESLMVKSNQMEQQIQHAAQRFTDETEAGNKTTAELALLEKQTITESLAELKEQIQDLFKRKQLLERAANAKAYHKTLELTTKELE